MKISITKKDIIWSYIGTIVNMGTNFLILPFIVYFLDEEMLGLWYIFASIGAITTLFDFGFAVTFARNITYCWSGATKLKNEDVIHIKKEKPNFYLMKKVLYTCRKIYLLISIVALIFLVTIGTSYIVYVSKTIAGYAHMIAWGIYIIAIFMNLYYGYYISFLRGVGAIAIANKNTIIARVIQIALSILLLVCGKGIIGACLAYLAYGVVFRLLAKYSFYNYCDIGVKLNEIEKSFSYNDMRELFAIVWHNAWRDGIISICDYLCNQASIIICSLFLSLTETGVYSLGMQIAQAIASIASTLYTTYQPTLQEAYIRKDIDKIRTVLAIIVTTYIGLFFGGIVVGCSLVIPLLNVIKPNMILSPTVLLGVCMYQFILKFRNIYASYFSCTNRIIYIRGFLFSAVFAVVFSFVIIGILDGGIWGVIIAQIISQCIYNVWKWPLEAHREIESSLFEIIKKGVRECVVLIKNIKQKSFS